MESRNKVSSNPKSSVTLHRNSTQCDSEQQDKYSERLDPQLVVTRPKSSVHRPKSCAISTSNDQSTMKPRPKSSGLPKLSDSGPSYSRSHTNTTNRNYKSNRGLLEMLSLAETSPRSSAPFLDHSPRNAKTYTKPRPKSCHIIACSSSNKPDDECRAQSSTVRVVRPKSSVEGRQHHSSSSAGRPGSSGAGRPGSSPCRQHREARGSRSPCRSAAGTRSRPCSSPCRSLYKSSDCNALYLASLAKIYDISQMRKLKQLQYKTLLLRQQQLGFNRHDEYESYSRYLRGPRTQEFDEHNHRVIRQMEHSGSVKLSTNKSHTVAFNNNNNNDPLVPHRKKFDDRQQRDQQDEYHKHKLRKQQRQQQRDKQRHKCECHRDKQLQQQVAAEEEEGGMGAVDRNSEFSDGNNPQLCSIDASCCDAANRRNSKIHCGPDDSKFDSSTESKNFIKDERNTSTENTKENTRNKKNGDCDDDDRGNINRKNAVHENSSETKANGKHGDGMTDRNNTNNIDEVEEHDGHCSVQQVHGNTSKDTKNETEKDTDTEPGNDGCEVKLMGNDVSNTPNTSTTSVTSSKTNTSGSSYTGSDTDTDTDGSSDTDTLTADCDSTSSSTECSCTDCNASSSDEAESVADK